MAEAIAYGMAGNILSTLSSHAVQKIASTVGVKKDLQKLERTLSTIKDVLKNADEQQLINSDELKSWVKNIKDACYEAEDLLDEFAYEALRRELQRRDKSFKKVWMFAYSIKSVSFRFKMSRRIKEVRENFDEIAAEKSKFHLHTKVARVQNQWREQTYSYVEESEVFGRDGDKNEIIDLLSAGDHKSVIAITGMGGLGKTTIAQLVYSDKALDQVFEMKMWIGVYQNFDTKKILEKILKSATKKECPDQEVDHLRTLIQEEVKGKKFLLVLDDVWNEDSDKWDKLKFVMSSGAKGSKVLITTRNVNVANIIGAELHTLKELSNDGCWNVFRERAFRMGEEQADPELVAIGKQMVVRCHGVPLAAKTLGSLMCLKTTLREWETVRDSDVWSLDQKDNDIMPVLRLSYNHLPFYLKSCFVYFALFPESWEHEKTALIQSWIAHGFVRSSSGDGGSLEDVGNEYVKELVGRSLILKPVYDDCHNPISFKIHDLVHKLARDVGGTTYFHSGEGIKEENSEQIRYAMLYRFSASEIKKAMYTMTNLRGLDLECALLAAGSFSRLKSLRSLDIKLTSGRIPSSIGTLKRIRRLILHSGVPSSIGTLKHLRRLILHSDDLKTIPESVADLLNLETLDLSSCPKLRKLPKDMGKMIKLRHFSLAQSARMSCMPLGFSHLISLQTLTMFFVGKGVGSELKELHGLIYLEGQLTIKNLENVSDARECAEVNLKEKKKLKGLTFSWNDQDVDDDVKKERRVDVLENLQPHSDLKILKVEGYMGSKFASWMMMKSLFGKLVEVSLTNCRIVENFPPFGEFQVLRDLFLKNMDAVKSIEGRCGNGSNSEWFPSLKKLGLENLCNLESFGLNGDFEALLSFPSLVELTIIGCPKLESMPLLPSLERLEVNSCGEKLVEFLLMLHAEKASTLSLVQLKSLTIKECGDLISLPENWSRLLVSMEELVIEDCSSFVSLEDESNAPESMCLLTLKISSLPKLVHLPHWFRKSTKLQNLRIDSCKGLIEVPEWIWELTSLRILEIVRCWNLKSLPDGMQSLTALEVLTIGYCSNLMRWPNGLVSLVLLKQLYIGCTSNLPSLPEELQLLTALSHLAIGNCETMLGLTEWLLNFTSLEFFGIYKCKNVRCFPNWFRKLTTLQTLYIDYCDELTSRCEKGTGADWPNIAHIPIIRLNGEFIQRLA